jgi:hypothetical protein
VTVHRHFVVCFVDYRLQLSWCVFAGKRTDDGTGESLVQKNPLHLFKVNCLCEDE